MAEQNLRGQVQELVELVHKLSALRDEDERRITDLEHALAVSVGYETRHYAEMPKAAEPTGPSRY